MGFLYGPRFDSAQLHDQAEFKRFANGGAFCFLQSIQHSTIVCLITLPLYHSICKLS